MEGASPTIRRRRLGRALRDFRLRKGLTGDAAGRAVERSGSWISRLEGGRVGLRTRDLRDLLDIYDVEDPRQREELEALAREGQRRGWWSKYAEGLPEQLVIFIGLEAAATTINVYQDTSIPGLLQTEAYCRAIHLQGVTAAGLVSPEDAEVRVRVRMARQSHVEQDPPELRFVLDESVLYRAIGGREILGAQLDELLRRAQNPHIDIRIIPFAHGDRIIVAGSHIIMGFQDDPDVVWLESTIGLTYEDGDEEVRTYQRIFESLTAAALDSDATNRLIREARAKLK